MYTKNRGSLFHETKMEKTKKLLSSYGPATVQCWEGRFGDSISFNIYA
jgi:hypothetical protein